MNMKRLSGQHEPRHFQIRVVQMKREFSIVALGTLTFVGTAYAQSMHNGSAATGSATTERAGSPAADSGMGSMQGGQGMSSMHGMHGKHFPPGYKKLELQMKAEMMESMARIMKKNARQIAGQAVGTEIVLTEAHQ